METRLTFPEIVAAQVEHVAVTAHPVQVALVHAVAVQAIEVAEDEGDIDAIRKIGKLL